MLNNFIYAQTKDLFLEQLNAGNILNEAIVFIEDTKEIWNHGTYFGGGSGSGEIDSELLSEIQNAVAQLQSDKADKSALADYALKSELPSLDGYLTKTTADGLYATIAQYNTLNQTVDNQFDRIYNRLEPLESYASVTYDEFYQSLINEHLLRGQTYKIKDFVTTSTQFNTQSNVSEASLYVQAISDCEIAEDALLVKNNVIYRVKYTPHNDEGVYSWANGWRIQGTNGNIWVSKFEEIVSAGVVKYKLVDATTEKTVAEVDLTGEEAVGSSVPVRIYDDFAMATDCLIISRPQDPRLIKLGAHPSNGLGFTYIGTYTDPNGMLYYRFSPKDGNPDVYVTFDKTHYPGTSPFKRVQDIGGGVMQEMAGIDVNVATPGKGVIYHMNDGWGNVTPYDYSSILFGRSRISDEVIRVDSGSIDETSDWFIKTPLNVGTKYIGKFTHKKLKESRVFSNENVGDMSYFYTFHVVSRSALGMGEFHYNTIEPTNTAIGYRRMLNNNLLLFSSQIDGAVSGMYNIKLGEYCYDTTIRNSYNIDIKGSCGKNIIIESHNILIGFNCYNNNIYGSLDVNLENQCSYNEIGQSSFINMGNLCENNVLYKTDSIGFKNGCVANFFIECSHYTLGNRCMFLESQLNSGSSNVIVLDDVKRFFIQGCSRITLDYSLVKLDDNYNTLSNVNDATILEKNGEAVPAEYVTQELLNYKLSDALFSVKRIAWADLVFLKNSATLIPGQFYRITDYVTTTAQDNTQSAGHRFDVIVLALDNHTLSEEAYACYNDEDSYFADAGANLSAWQIWYDLDNDTNRFAWADEENGKGVIYRMIDEWSNDCPYDFKNIMFIRYELEAPALYEEGAWVDWFAEMLRYQFTEGSLPYIWGGLIDGEDRFWEKSWETVSSAPTGNSQSFFTFSDTNNENADSSLSSSCRNNVMGVFYDEDSGARTLNNNVFFGSVFYDNIIENGCRNNGFGNSCNSNIIGKNTNSCNFGSRFNRNKIDSNAEFSQFGENCSENVIGDGLIASCIWRYSFRNNIGNNCENINIRLNGDSNVVNSQCYEIDLGENARGNVFGVGCNSIIFGDTDNRRYYRGIVFGNYCESIHILNDERASSSSQVQYYRIARGVTGEIEVERGRDYETTIAKNSSGEIVQFNIADLV